MKAEMKIRNAIEELKSGIYATRRHAMKASLEIAEKHKIKGLLVNEAEVGNGVTVKSAIGWTDRVRVTA